MKKLLKILGVILLVISILIALFFIYAKIKHHQILNTPRLSDNYYESFTKGGNWEVKYANRGSYDVSYLEYESDNKSIKNIRIWYPTELKNNDKKYPLIMVVNGSETPAKVYLPFFERLASWGFIVVGNDDPQTGNGDTASITLDYVLNDSELSKRIDTNNMGIAGYSQGGAGALSAVTKHDNGKMYKTIFTGSAAYPFLAKNMGWEYDASDIKIPYFMTSATGTSDDRGVDDINTEFGGVAPLASLVDIYDKMSNDIFKIRARVAGAEHEEMQVRTDGYMTAWMLYQLKNDDEAGKVFIGEKAEILDNANWQDIEKNN